MTASVICDDPDSDSHFYPPVDSHPRNVNDRCALFTAPSTLGPETGNGVFSVLSVPVGGRIGQTPSVPLFGSWGEDGDGRYLQIDGSINQYVWNERSSSNLPSNAEIVPGICSQLNHHPPTIPRHVRESEGYSAITYDRRTSPAAGAQTERLDYGFSVESAISPGDEIFADYGPDWLSQRGVEPMDDEGREFAGKITKGLAELFTSSNFTSTSSTATANADVEIIKFVKEVPWKSTSPAYET